MRKTWVLLVSLALAGCVATGSSDPTAATTTGTAGESSTPAVATPVPPTSTGPAQDDYRGPLAMPAADAKPMLWPTTSPRVVEAYGTNVFERYGFVDASGAVVVQPTYDSYEYCPDATGRAAYVIGTNGDRRAEVLDLTGKLIARTPTSRATCAGPDHVIFSKAIEAELGRYRSGIMDLSGAIVLALGRDDRTIDLVRGELVNVSERAGEYFLDLATGTRTRHAGWLIEAGMEAGAPGLPAAKQRDFSGAGADVGFVSLAGAWVVKPQFTWASAFRAGHASVERDERTAFLDSGLNQVGGEWDEVNEVDDYRGRSFAPVGYQVARDGQQGLLAADLHAIVEPQSAQIDCPWASRGACSVTAADGSATLVLLPEGTSTDMPAGFSRVITAGFLADQDENGDDEVGVHRVYAVAGGQVLTSVGWRGCEPAGTVWLTCEPVAGMAPPEVFDAKGNRTPFRSIKAVPDPTDGADRYYWVTAGKYQGFVDETGAWRYRESRFTQLED